MYFWDVSWRNIVNPFILFSHNLMVRDLIVYTPQGLTLLHSEQLKLHRVLAVLSAIRLNSRNKSTPQGSFKLKSKFTFSYTGLTGVSISCIMIFSVKHFFCRKSASH